MNKREPDKEGESDAGPAGLHKSGWGAQQALLEMLRRERTRPAAPAPVPHDAEGAPPADPDAP